MARLLIGLLLLLTVAGGCAASGEDPSGKTPRRVVESLRPLRPSTANPRYFTDGRRLVYLTGFHTWTNLVDRGTTSPPPQFDYARYLGELTRYGHNFIRLWAWELPQYRNHGRLWHVSPQPWRRTGPGEARDGLPRFDLEKFDERYFERLRQRVVAANRRGIYVSVMLFEGWEARFAQAPLGWHAHPFAHGNNVNGIAADANRDGRGFEYFTLGRPGVLAFQRAYARHVVETVADLPNVLFEISNEADVSSHDWQLAMARTVRRELARRGVSRPVGMTAQHGGDNDVLYRSPADWISPGGHVFASSPPLAEPHKVALLDTDHACGVCGDAALVWESFTRGYNVVFMDDLSASPAHERARLAMGQARALADRIGLERMEPLTDVCSTRFCLASEDEYVVFQPRSGSFAVELPSRAYEAEWLRVSDGRTSRRRVQGRGTTRVTPPFPGAAVLYLRPAR